MGLFSSNAKVQQSVDNATKAFQAIVHQSTAAFTRNANDAAKKATDSIDVLSVRSVRSELVPMCFRASLSRVLIATRVRYCLTAS